MKNREDHINHATKGEDRRWACKEREDRFWFFRLYLLKIFVKKNLHLTYQEAGSFLIGAP